MPSSRALKPRLNSWLVQPFTSFEAAQSLRTKSVYVFSKSSLLILTSFRSHAAGREPQRCAGLYRRIGRRWHFLQRWGKRAQCSQSIPWRDHVTDLEDIAFCQSWSARRLGHWRAAFLGPSICICFSTERLAAASPWCSFACHWWWKCGISLFPSRWCFFQ